jgi:alcohol dehydrogenase class IV
MRYSVERMESPERYAQMAAAMGEPVEGLSAKEAALAAVRAVEKLCRDIGIPSIKDLDIDGAKYESLVPTMAKDCLASGSPASNPVVPTEEDVEMLYRELLK